ncbi:MAG: CBS domain-containing protein [Kiritimatiellae bacterium]|jgi:CBS domain-containing protein|nr:CBS domain-containing protein [Kiritimatiellia bacterium]
MNEKLNKEILSKASISKKVDHGTEPLVLVEMIQRLKVRDVMTTTLATVERAAPLSDVQALMKAKQISGVPVEEGGRFLGLVTINDIIRALEGGYIDETCQKHMSTKLVVLEDDMPLSFALRYFEKYHFGRFPVINREQKLVGIICQRDINRALLLELTNELNRLESESSHYKVPEGPFNLYVLREFPVSKFDFENAGKAANKVKQLLKEKKFPAKIIRRIAVAAYELEINLCVHSDGGSLSWQLSNGRAEIIAHDSGPGIADVEWALKDGNSTASEWIRSFGFGAGMGLVNVKRVSDEFEIESTVGLGTRVKAVIYINPDAKR